MLLYAVLLIVVCLLCDSFSVLVHARENGLYFAASLSALEFERPTYLLLIIGFWEDKLTCTYYQCCCICWALTKVWKYHRIAFITCIVDVKLAFSLYIKLACCLYLYSMFTESVHLRRLPGSKKSAVESSIIGSSIAYCWSLWWAVEWILLCVSPSILMEYLKH